MGFCAFDKPAEIPVAAPATQQIILPEQTIKMDLNPLKASIDSLRRVRQAPKLVYGVEGADVSTTQAANRQVSTPNNLHALIVYSDASAARTIVRVNDADSYVIPAGGPWVVDLVTETEQTKLSVRASATETGKKIWITVV